MDVILVVALIVAVVWAVVMTLIARFWHAQAMMGVDAVRYLHGELIRAGSPEALDVDADR